MAFFGFGKKKGAAALSADEWFDKGVEHCNSERYADAVNCFLKAAELGVPEAMFNLGVIYGEGQGVNKNINEALKWYEKAVAFGSSEAMFNLGVIYLEGEDAEQDITLARGWFEKAKAAGNEEAATALEKLEQDEWFNKAVAHNKAKHYADAVECFKKAAGLGSSTAMYNLGVMYESGDGADRDYAMAREWYEKAKDAGNEDAAAAVETLEQDEWFNKAIAHEEAKRYADAMECFQKAAGLGSSAAMYNLGLMYGSGDGVDRDYALARGWLEKAKAAGDEDATEALEKLEQEEWFDKAIAHEKAKRYADAVECFKKAAGLGSSTAMYNLGVMYESGDGADRDYALAREWIEKAAAAGCDEADGILAVIRDLEKNGNNAEYLYEKGREHLFSAHYTGEFGSSEDTAADMAKARIYFKKAAALGNYGAMHSLGIMYDNGDGVTKDKEKARELIEKAEYLENRERERDREHFSKMVKNAKSDNEQFAMALEYASEGRYAEAANCYEQAAKQGCIPAMHYLADLYVGGKGVEYDLELARDWYYKAYDGGDKTALEEAELLE